MSLADQFENTCNEIAAATDAKDYPLVITLEARLVRLSRDNKDTILAALRGRDAVLEEAALACNNAGWSMPIEEFQKMTKREHSDRACRECAAVIRVMKEGKHV